jgi:hypothetical protein
MPGIRRRDLLALLALLPLLALPVAAQDSAQADPSPKPPKRLWTAHDPVSFRLTADFKQAFRDRDTTKQEWIPGTFSFTEEDRTVTVPVEITTRGHFRLKYCNFPMLRVRLPNDSLKGTLFQGQGTIKVSTHCKTDNQRLEEVVVQDYFTYRIYNLLSDMSFRVRLGRATYVNTGEAGKPPVEAWAYFLEDEDDMAKRAGGKPYELENVSDQSKMVSWGVAEPQQSAMMSVFAYMVGFSDFSLPYQHNARVIQTATGYYPVPYDFDWSGLVDAPYARPDYRLGTKSVRERVWRGPDCIEEQDLNGVLAKFRAQKDSIWSLYQTQTILDQKRVKESLDYLQEFYKIIDDPRRVRRELQPKCGT